MPRIYTDTESTDSGPPIYTKFHRKHIDPRTLDRFGFSWEWDDDDESSDYLLIEGRITREVQKELFDHTRWLLGHSRHGPSNGLRHDYKPPKCRLTGDLLSSDVNLKLDVFEGHKFAANSASIPDDFAGGSINISSSRVHSDDKVALYRKDESMDSQTLQFSWIHMQKATRNFDEFTRFASSVPGLTDEDVAVILSLLKKVRSCETSAYSGKYLQPTVLRCNGRGASELNEPAEERSATFICFPYYSTEAMTDASQIPTQSSMHHTRSLLQTFYNLESTKKRDLEQVVQKTGLFQNHIICVPQLWAVILNSRIIITSAPVSPFHTAKHSLKILDPPKPPTASSPSVIRVNDPHQRTFFLPMEHCKTWFALMDKISHHCLTDYNLHQYECQLLDSDNVPINSEDWHTLITSQSSTILSIQIRLLSLEALDPGGRVFNAKRKSDFSDIEEEQELLKPSARSYTKNSSEAYTRRSTIERRGTAGVYRDPRVTSMSLIRRVPTYKSGELEKYDNDSDNTRREGDWRLTRYNTSNDPPPNRVTKYPLPPSSGVVVNKVKHGENKVWYADATSDIYFTPKETPDLEDTFAGGYRFGKGADETRTEARNNEETHPKTTTHRENLHTGSAVHAPSDIELHVPPVFTWAVGRRSGAHGHSEGNGSSENTIDTNPDVNGPAAMADPSQEEEETLNNVSNHINSQLLELKQHGDDLLYKNTKTVSLFDVEDSVVKDILQTSTVTLLNRRLAAKDLETNKDATTRRDDDLKFLASTLFKLFDFFIPLPYPCDVADKYWGAVYNILTMLPLLRDMSDNSDPSGQPKKPGRYIIVDLSGSAEADLRNAQDMRLLTGDIPDCVACRGGQHYSSRAEAMDHLFANHFTVSPRRQSNISPNWVMDYEQCLDFKRRQDGQRILDNLVSHSDELEKLGLEIQYGVSENGKFDRETYRIPSSLVDSFRHILMMVVLAGHMAKEAYQTRREYDSMHIPLGLSFIENKDLHRLVQCGSRAETCMDDAKREIVLMTYTDDSSDIVSYEAVSPQLVLALFMGDIRGVDSMNNKLDLIEIYRNYLLKLQFKVNQHPNQRLLQGIHHIVEELEILDDISRYQQHLVLNNYRQTLRPTSFRVTTESRISAFALENDRLVKLLETIDGELRDLESLIQKAESLLVQTQRGIEVRQEDHGKAILAFTIVTVIFLPMSFATSFFGMNTVDIRDTTSTQALFWAIALPVTFSMITITLLVGFKGDIIREWIVERFSKDDQQTQRQWPKLFKGNRNEVEEDAEENIDNNSLPKRRRWRERKSERASTEQSEHLV